MKQAIQETCEDYIRSVVFGEDVPGMRAVKFPEVEYKEVEVLTEHGFKPIVVTLLENGNVLIKYQRFIE